jgi:GNAT superfamily N-acetyltransferase
VPKGAIYTKNMNFELSDELMDDILFSMEDQETEFCIDTQRGIVLNREDIAEGAEEAEKDRFIYIPDWDSSSGFRLMEHFAASLRNPLLREELGAALNQGRGVFRAFKDILSQYPEAEKLWFAYKEKEMKREIIRWYNALREEWGMSLIGLEPEDTRDLVLEDFRFREYRENDLHAAQSLHALCREESPLMETLWIFPAEYSLVAETGHGDFAGYIAAAEKAGILHIYALEIRHEYRGLGLGETLLSRFLEKFSPAAEKTNGIERINIELPRIHEGFSRVLLRFGFKAQVVSYSLERPAGSEAGEGSF